MKKSFGLILVLLLTLFCFSALADVAINEMNFPDANFRQCIIDEGLDRDSNGTLSDDEITAAIKIICKSKGIHNLKGIEHFTNLQRLWCNDNQLTSLDVSRNTVLQELYCGENQLTNLDVSRNTAIRNLYCDENQLTSLDVSTNTALKMLYCNGNQFTSLDLSMNPALTELCCDENQLTSLDVSTNTALEKLYCGENQLTHLDVSKNPALIALYCSDNQIASLDLENNPVLRWLWCPNNRLSGLNVDKNPGLWLIDCSLNHVTSLDVSKNIDLFYLRVSATDIQSLNLSKNRGLGNLRAEFSGIKELDISSCPNLCSAVEYYDRQTVPATTDGWNEYGYNDHYDIWKEGDTLYLSCNTTTKVIAGDFISEPSGSAEPAVGDTFTSDGLKYKVSSKSTAVFTGIEKAKSGVSIPATVSYSGKSYKVTEIAAKAFYQDTIITSVSIGKNVKTIGKSAFEGCKKLKTVKGGAAVADIRDAAFRGCVKLASITLEKNVKSIGKNAFNGDKALKTITVKTAKLTTSSVKSGSFKGIYKKATFKCPKAQLKAYKKLFVKKGAPKTCKFK